MKILIVHYRYYPYGGPEKYLFNVTRLLEAHGHEVVHFSVRSGKNVPSPWSGYFVEPIGGGDAFNFSEYRKTPKTVLQLLSRSIWSPEVKRALQREIRETKPDLVYILSFINKLSPSVIAAAKDLGIPTVLRLSDYYLLCPRFDFLREKKVCEDCLHGGLRCCLKHRCVQGSLPASLIRVLAMRIHRLFRIYDRIDALICPSDFMRRKLQENGFPAEKLVCIPTFREPELAAGAPEKRNGNADFGKEKQTGAYGLYFGRISEEKGIETAVRAYASLPESRLKIMGDDSTAEAARLKEFVSDLGLDNVEFIGYRTGDALEEVIRGARFVLIPSVWYDNLPNTALEAFRLGKPVIASDIGSLPELVQDGVNGLLFTPGDPASLADAVRRLEADSEEIRRMGENSRKLLQSRFSPEAHYDALIRVFQNVCPDRI